MLYVNRKTTFSQARRFEDEKAIYGPRMANFSLIDINDYFKPYNGAPKLDKFSFRKDTFKTGQETEEEKLLRAYTRMKPVTKEENADGMDDQHETNFHPREHKKV